MTAPGRVAPPSREGVSASSVALPSGPWPRVIDFLIWRFPRVEASEWRQRLWLGDVTDEAGHAVAPDAPYPGHGLLHYFRRLEAEVRIPGEAVVVFQDDHIVVADKPHFLPVTPAGRYLQETLLVRLKRKLGLDDLAPVHRIDRETAGLVLFTTRPALRGPYHALFRERQVEKCYEAIAPWRAELELPRVHCSHLSESGSFMQMAQTPGAPNSETRIELIEVRESMGLGKYCLRPVTGKRHQLRVHMAALGIPILNDQIYPRLAPERPPEGGDDDAAAAVPPLQLLAKSLAFTDPISGRARSFESQRQLQFERI